MSCPYKTKGRASRNPWYNFGGQIGSLGRHGPPVRMRAWTSGSPTNRVCRAVRRVVQAIHQKEYELEKTGLFERRSNFAARCVRGGRPGGDCGVCSAAAGASQVFIALAEERGPGLRSRVPGSDHDEIPRSHGCARSVARAAGGEREILAGQRAAADRRRAVGDGEQHRRLPAFLRRSGARRRRLHLRDLRKRGRGHSDRATQG